GAVVQWVKGDAARERPGEWGEQFALNPIRVCYGGWRAEGRMIEGRRGKMSSLRRVMEGSRERRG
ncbi:hypothetical protein JOQ06_028397, partial [Pogonophryne albipinna]